MMCWLSVKMKDWYVVVSGDDTSNLCGMSETAQCNSMGHAMGSSTAQLSSTITVLCGKHGREEKTINIGDNISVVGIFEAVSVIGTNTLSSSSTTLFQCYELLVL
ncbi:uncharacterized protein MONOS_11482 [Monocercomonoides exilis]|uniref:uncharacterized protein n=1 Tax=Monocercomonoides exilis TaxID=2049356 RepID=UPI00355A3FE8|nr:hypothetical protein MONOS_11482 [Monocercomonoides exilis]|eukprot:MONOS_11482.1-p1 / transcript=MONOS_11482.1 / gene=MONOS_11482 / organism=Monocercomonoides_exilis_PA203 / gene_product=unspecified product / transcript_product=unspecified product / location=Mono_scaffold00579:6249-6563(+) / protein_length=105 / sequence_SO=supercontig / SO=protein_coding / is_pseudo=false